MEELKIMDNKTNINLSIKKLSGLKLLRVETEIITTKLDSTLIDNNIFKKLTLIFEDNYNLIVENPLISEVVKIKEYKNIICLSISAIEDKSIILSFEYGKFLSINLGKNSTYHVEKLR
jgi:hypothetical protein